MIRRISNGLGGPWLLPGAWYRSEDCSPHTITSPTCVTYCSTHEGSLPVDGCVGGVGCISPRQCPCRSSFRRCLDREIEDVKPTHVLNAAGVVSAVVGPTSRVDSRSQSLRPPCHALRRSNAMRVLTIHWNRKYRVAHHWLVRLIAPPPPVAGVKPGWGTRRMPWVEICRSFLTTVATTVRTKPASIVDLLGWFRSSLATVCRSSLGDIHERQVHLRGADAPPLKLFGVLMDDAMLP